MGQSIKHIYKSLDKLFENAKEINLKDHEKLVIFSDLHMGAGGKNDDFKPNEELFSTAIQSYLNKNYSLALNGDVEELQRFSYEAISNQWKKIIDLFIEFHKNQKLFKTIGNHDIDFLIQKPKKYALPADEALKIRYKDNFLFLFHGHQASKKYTAYNKLVGYVLKYVANPLRIKNYSVSHDSRKQYAIEKRVYHYSVFRKVVSIIGHTHRPLFESLGKAERVKFKIEQLCRDYINPDYGDKGKIKKSIKGFKKDLKKLYKKSDSIAFSNNLYNSIFHLPCLFNSGCVVGKRGITGLEIEGGDIRLVHWFDKKTSKKYLKYTGYEPEQLGDTDYYRMVLNEESLDYIFTRINLLA